jgi:membrane associated rhomboid family serine protease
MLSGSALPESPGLWEARRYPVTAGIAVAALLVSLADWAGIELPLVFDVRFVLQPWRLVTSMLPHVDGLHLVFNLCWLWTFGTALERALGPWRYLALVAAVDSVSAAAEYALVVGGVGLSGVVYGFLGFLWARRRDPRFALLVQPATVLLFVFWFLLCLVLTLAGIWPVANVAHAAGAATGVLLGGLRADTARRRRLRLGAAVALMVLALAGATALRRYVNLSPARAADQAGADGYRALLGGRDVQAVFLLSGALQLDSRRAALWFNLGLAYDRLELAELAWQAFESAARIEPGDAGYRRAADRAAARLRAAAGTYPTR